MSYLEGMPRRTDLVFIAAGPVLAVSLLAVNAVAGRAVVEAVYDGRTPVDLLNDIITGQSVYPVDYHLHKARDLVHRLAWLLGAAGPLAAAYVASARRRPDSALAQPLVGGMLLSTALLCGLYLLHLPLLKVLPGWFWPLHDKPLPLVWLVLPLAAGSWYVIRAVTGAPEHRRRNLLLLIVWGACLQHGFVWLEGDGFAHLKQRLTDTGHAAFARTAVEQPSIWQVVTRYEELLATEAPDAYFHATKPPGLQVFLMGAERLSHALPGEGVDRLANLAAVLFPVLAFACLLPLFGLLRLGTPDQEDVVAGLLYLFVPSVALINLHADQYLYPLLGVTCLYLYGRALIRGELVAAALAGLGYCLSLWFSFALLALLPAIPVLAWTTGRTSAWPSAARTIGVAAVGCLAGYQLLLWGTDYDALARWTQAMAAHESAKVPQWGVVERFYYAGLNLVEFALWCGPPLALLCAADLCRTLSRVATGSRDLEEGLVMSLAAILLGLVVVGGTAGETARLWIFLVPLATISAARTLRRMAPGSLPWVVGLQFVLIVVMKARQDFF